jgi:hypothetical protein
MKGCIFVVIALLLLVLGVLVYHVAKPYLGQDEESRGLMLLVEFEGEEGMVNFVNELQKRSIPSVLLVSADLVADYCQTIRILENYNLEVGGLYPEQALWDIPFEEQYSIIENLKDGIESCTQRQMKVFASRYFAYDENTLKAATELGIPIVLARGTTKQRATIFKPEEYDVKILSVSNVDSPQWGAGSLSDYSYWAGGGTPEDLAKELVTSARKDKISPVSHTYIGGTKKRWLEAYLSFFDQNPIHWQTLDDFMVIDEVISVAHLQLNKEVRYHEPRPLIPLDQEKNVDNLCSIGELSAEAGFDEVDASDKIVFFHNNSGPMCLQALDFLESLNYDLEEHIDDEMGFPVLLDKYRSLYRKSEGISESFEYYPIIFINTKAFSGFSDDIGNQIKEELHD